MSNRSVFSRSVDRRRYAVLWIDDEVVPTDAAVRWLMLDGFRISCASSGMRGVAKARSTAYDAVLLDLRLPDMTWMAVLQALQSSSPAPIGVITGVGDARTRGEVEALGVHYRCSLFWPMRLPACCGS